MPDKRRIDVVDGGTYTTEEIAELGFAPINQTYAGLPIYGRGNERCLLEPLDGGRFRVAFTYQSDLIAPVHM